MTRSQKNNNASTRGWTRRCNIPSYGILLVRSFERSSLGSFVRSSSRNVLRLSRYHDVRKKTERAVSSIPFTRRRSSRTHDHESFLFFLRKERSTFFPISCTRFERNRRAQRVCDPSLGHVALPDTDARNRCDTKREAYRRAVLGSGAPYSMKTSVDPRVYTNFEVGLARDGSVPRKESIH